MPMPIPVITAPAPISAKNFLLFIITHHTNSQKSANKHMLAQNRYIVFQKIAIKRRGGDIKSRQLLSYLTLYIIEYFLWIIK